MIFAKAVNVLSVKLLGLAVSITRKKSLKNQLNGIGPTIDPSGTHEIDNPDKNVLKKRSEVIS